MPDSPLFSTIRAKHAKLLRQSTQGAVAADFIKEVRDFIESVRLSGREIVDEDDRDYLRSLLTFWGNWLYNQTRTYPNTNLELFTAEAAAAAGKKVVEQIGKGEPIGRELRYQLAIGGVTALVVGVAAILILGGMAFLVLPRGGMAQATLPVEQTVEAMSTTLSAPTDTPPATATETPPPTAEFGVTSFPTLAATATRAALATPVRTPTPTSGGGGGGSPTPTGFTPEAVPSETTPVLPVTGGGGFAPPPVGILSVQVIEPENGAIIAVNQPFGLSATFYNLQFGWQLFFVLTRFDTAQSLILPDSLPIQNDGASGAVSVRAALSEPGLYTVGVYIATSQQEIQRLQRWAETGFAVPPETLYDGVILFRDLALFEIQ